MYKIYQVFAVVIVLVFYSMQAQAQVVVIPFPGETTTAVYTAQAPMVLTGSNNTEITFDISQMPVVPLNKIPSAIPSSRLALTPIAQPSLTLMCTIVMQGIFPSRSGTDAYIGEIMWGGWSFAPRASAQCDGQLIAINANTALFSLLGTTYGGDGRTTFQLPDMRGRVAVHTGTGPGLSNRRLGSRFGTETIGQ